MSLEDRLIVFQLECQRDVRLWKLWGEIKQTAKELVRLGAAIEANKQAGDNWRSLSAEKDQALVRFGEQSAKLRNMAGIRDILVPNFSAQNLANLPD